MSECVWGFCFLFFAVRPSHLIRSCSPWTSFLHLKRSTEHFLQFRKSSFFEYNAGISTRKLQESWTKPKTRGLAFENQHWKQKASFHSYVLQHTGLDGKHVPRTSICHWYDWYVTSFNQGSSKLAPCVFSVNWFFLSFRFQRTLEAPSKDVVCQKTYQNKTLFLMLLSATCEIPHLPLHSPGSRP